MKASLKFMANDILFRMYGPVMKRVEKAKAVKLWREGVNDCIKMYKEIGAPRVYLFWDDRSKVFAPMTWTDNKLMKPSLIRLRTMGKIRGTNIPDSVAAAKESSFYYTPSKWGALGCDEDNNLRTLKLKMWVDFYLFNLSEPMKKYLSYQLKYDLRHHQQA